MSRILDCRNRLRRLLTVAPASLLGASTLTINKSAMALQNWKPPWWPPPHRPPVVPEANAGLVLLPIVIAVILVSSLRLLRKRAAQKQ